MAEAKKKKLTQEERLEEILLPDWEQPYSLPKNWVWTRLANLIVLISGRDVSIKLCNDKGIGIPYLLGASNLDKNTFYIERWIEKTQVVSSAGDILLSVKGTIGKIYLQKEEKINISRQIMALRPLPLIKTLYLKFYLTHICDSLRAAGNGLIPGISRETILTYVCPLPPLVEQQRIVERVESLFEKIEIIRELAQSALESFETRKAAILQKAFSGELTAEWRKENGVTIASWEKTQIGTICCIGSGGTPSRTNKEYYEGEIPWVKTGEINWNIIFDTEEHISDQAIENSSAKIFPIGTVLVAMYGQGLTRGRVAILGIEAATNQAVCALIPYNKALNYYLYYFFQYNYWEFREKAVGGNQPNLSGKIISQLPINLPTFPEQKEIVRILDNLWEKEQKAKELCDIKDKLEQMKKSILARAFRGELGTNDPSEESALDLLRSILMQRTKESGKTAIHSKSKTIRLSDDIEKMMDLPLEREVYLFIKKRNSAKFSEIMTISKKNLEILEGLRSLEKKKIIKKENDTYFCAR